MLRCLKDVTLPFMQATDPGQVLATLDAVASQAGLRLYGIVPEHLVNREENAGTKTMFGSSVSAGFRADMVTEYKRHAGPSIVRQFVKHRPPPFTLTEVMQRLRPTGKDRWIFDVLRDHGVRDGLHCTHSPWVVVYNTDHVFKGSEMTNEVRTAIDVASAMAINRIKEVTALPSPAPLSKLSPRETSVLLYLSDGLSVGQIAERLVLSETTVKTFVRRATKKLEASSQLHAVTLALRNRLI